MPVGRALRTLATCVDLAVFLWRRYNAAAQGAPPASADAPHDVAATAAEGPSTEIGQTVTFGLDGQKYAIDLSDEDAADMRKALGRYIAAGRPMGRKSRTANTPPARLQGRQSAAANGHEASAIRTWARANGHRISDRGPIPAAVRQAYDAGQ